MWPHIIITAVALFALGCEAVAAAKGTSGPHQGKSIGGSRQDGRRSASGDYSRSSQARRLNQQPPTRNGYAKEVRGKDDELVLDNGRKARKPRAGLDEATEDYDHVEARGNFRVLDGYFVGPADNRVEEPSRAAHRRRLNSSGAGDQNGNLIEEDDYWEDGEEGEYVDSGVDFDFSENELLDSDDAIDDDRHQEKEGYDEEEIELVESGDDCERSGRRRQRWDDDEGDALGSGMRPSRHRADSRRRPSSTAMPPAGREKKGGSMMKSVGSATGRSAKALVHALQPKSVGLGEILDTWKIEQVIGKPPGRVTRCAATVEFRRDGTVATSFEGREIVSDFTFKSHSWPRACTIEFEARAFQGPWDKEPVWKTYKGFFSRKLLDPKVIMLEGIIYEETRKMLWKRKAKVGKFVGRRRPSRASRGGSISKSIGGERFEDDIGLGGTRGSGYRGQRERRNSLQRDRGGSGGRESAMSSHREAGARRRGGRPADNEL